jgi:hypothetical protein
MFLKWGHQMCIKKMTLLFLASFIFNIEIFGEDVPKSELISYWKKELAKFNYSLPTELEENFIKSIFTGGGGEDKNTYVYVTKRDIEFPNENINYAIYFVNKANPLTGSDAKLAAFFNNEKLVLLTSTTLYLDKYRRYEFGGLIVRDGLAYEFEENGLLTISCLESKTRESYIEIMSKQYCGESITVGPQNTILNVRKHKEKCEYPCAPFYPFREKGNYFVSQNNANLRRDPHSNGIISKFLSKDTKVEVIEDTFKQEIIVGFGVANYVKVRLEDGGEGYLHGAYLRAPGEPDVVLIREKAEEWKKKNGWKGK